MLSKQYCSVPADREDRKSGLLLRAKERGRPMFSLQLCFTVVHESLRSNSGILLTTGLSGVVWSPTHIPKLCFLTPFNLLTSPAQPLQKCHMGLWGCTCACSVLADSTRTGGTVMGGFWSMSLTTPYMGRC